MNLSLIIVKCLKQVCSLEIGVECAVTVILLNPYVAISVKFLRERKELKEIIPGKKPPPKKKHIARDEHSCSSDLSCFEFCGF